MHVHSFSAMGSCETFPGHGVLDNSSTTARSLDSFADCAMHPIWSKGYDVGSMVTTRVYFRFCKHAFDLAKWDG